MGYFNDRLRVLLAACDRTEEQFENAYCERSGKTKVASRKQVRRWLGAKEAKGLPEEARKFPEEFARTNKPDLIMVSDLLDDGISIFDFSKVNSMSLGKVYNIENISVQLQMQIEGVANKISALEEFSAERLIVQARGNEDILGIFRAYRRHSTQEGLICDKINIFIEPGALLNEIVAEVEMFEEPRKTDKNRDGVIEKYTGSVIYTQLMMTIMLRPREGLLETEKDFLVFKVIRSSKMDELIGMVIGVSDREPHMLCASKLTLQRADEDFEPGLITPKTDDELSLYKRLKTIKHYAMNP